ncbi:MAG: hypothetical protein K6A94_12040 [Bacteroidales bacterium]|nr:hypothetical protein [Bacteroidales bacterium]
MSKNISGKFKSSVEWLSKPSNAITVGVLVIVAILVTVWIAGKIKSSIKTVRDEINKPNPNPANLTPGLDFAELAQRLWDATVEHKSLGAAQILILNLPTGTDEDEVYAVLGALRTQDDYLKLKQEWINIYKATSDFATWINPGTVSTLPGALHAELTSSELQRCRNILTNHGITPDF